MMTKLKFKNSLTSLFLIVAIALGNSLFSQDLDSANLRYSNREVDDLWLEGKFDLIIHEYTFRLAEDSSNADALYHLGAAYVSDQKNLKQAQVHFEKVLELEKQTEFDEFFYFLGRIYHLNHNYFFALAAYTTYLFDLPEIKRNQEYLEEIEDLILKAENGTDLIEGDSAVFNRFVTFSKHKVLYFTEGHQFIEINNMGDKINSAFSEYGPVIFSEEKMLLFTSRRPNKTSREIYFDGQPYEDIYAAFDNEGEWHDIQPIDGLPFFNDELFNTEDHDATVSLSKNDLTLLIFKENTVMLMHRDPMGEWSELEKVNKVIHQKLPFVNGASISSDGNLLVISATNPHDKKNEHLDLYTIRKDTLGKWSHINNMESPVNTEFNETSPYIFNDTTLFFSSNSTESIGEYDVFLSTFSNGAWTKPENLGVPINSAYNEVNYSIGKESKYAFLASDRPKGYGKYDIYRVSNGINLRSKNIALMAQGREHGELLTQQPSNKPYDRLGLTTEVEKEYDIKVDSTGNLYAENTATTSDDELAMAETSNQSSNSATASTSDNSSNTSNTTSTSNSSAAYANSSSDDDDEDDEDAVKVNVKDQMTVFEFFTPDEILAVIANNDYSLSKDGAELPLNPISVLKLYFDFDESHVGEDQQNGLDQLVALAKKSPKLKIFIAGHTDSKGGTEYNVKLSERRANSVRDHLTNHGFSNVIKTFGHGESRPFILDESEEAHAANRHVEIRLYF